MQHTQLPTVISIQGNRNLLCREESCYHYILYLAVPARNIKLCAQETYAGDTVRISDNEVNLDSSFSSGTDYELSLFL